jgi:N-acetylmuramoyl-L-alanine amidase
MITSGRGEKKIKVIVLRTGFFRKLLLVAFLVFFFTLGADRLVDARRQESVKALSRALVKKVVVVDPGHGGVDPGAVGKNNILEKDLVLEVGHRLTTFLRQGGAKVIMTRETDTDLSDPELRGLYAKKRQDLARRVALAGNSPADLLISIHINSFPNPRQHGAQTFCQAGSPASRQLALVIQKELNFFLKDDRRVPLTGNYYILKESKIPTVIVEIGFLSNPQEYKLLQDPAYQTKIAWCLYAGLVHYFASAS